MTARRAARRVVVDDPMLTVAEAAEYLRLSERTVYELARTGQLRAFKPLRKAIRFRRSWLDAYEAAHSSGGDAGSAASPTPRRVAVR